MTSEREEGQPYIPPGMLNSAKDIVKRKQLEGLGVEDLKLAVHAARRALLLPDKVIRSRIPELGITQAEIELGVKAIRARTAGETVSGLMAHHPDQSRTRYIRDVSETLARTLPPNAARAPTPTPKRSKPRRENL